MTGAPMIFVPVRGQWLRAAFLTRPDGGVAWWLVHSPEITLDETEAALIDDLVAAEVMRRQREWREAQERRRIAISRPVLLARAGSRGPEDAA